MCGIIYNISYQKYLKKTQRIIVKGKFYKIIL